jgi:hypothetical protein
LSIQQVKIFLGARVNGIRATWPVHGCNKCERAEWKGAERGWQMKYGGGLSQRLKCGTWNGRIGDGKDEGD